MDFELPDIKSLIDAPKGWSVAVCISKDFEMSDSVARKFKNRYSEGINKFTNTFFPHVGDIIMQKKSDNDFIFYLVSKEYDGEPEDKLFGNRHIEMCGWKLGEQCKKFNIKNLALSGENMGIEFYEHSQTIERIEKAMDSPKTYVHII